MAALCEHHAHPHSAPFGCVSGLFEDLRAKVLNGVISVNSKRNYAKALDELQAFCIERKRPPSRALLLEFRSVTLERDSEPIDDQRQAVCDSRSHRRGPASRCSGCGESFSDDGYIQYPAAGKASRELADSGAGQRAAGSPGCSTLKGKRDYVILSLLVGCALRRRELASLSIEEIQMREGRWVIADLRGKAIASGPWPYPSG